MGSTLNPTQKTHIVWLDVVRLVAMFTVVCCHSADPFNFYPGEPPANIAEIKWWGAVYGSLLRPCVPLFVMITGALLLPVKGEVAPFYRKRIGRVFWPFLIWSVIYNLFPWITGLMGVAPEVILDFFPYSGEEVMRQSLDVSLGYIAQMPFNFSLLDVHMWYIYLLIGLYLYMPVFSAWVEKASRDAFRSLLQRICRALHLGFLFLERVLYALYVCRIQRLSAVRTLSASHGMESGKNTGVGNPHVCRRFLCHVLRFPSHDRITRLHGRTARTFLLLLFTERGADDHSVVHALQESPSK